MEKSKVQQQLRRIEGQIRGINMMIETDRGLVATMQQLLAADASLKKVMRNYVLLFLETKNDTKVELTPDQLSYIVKLLGE